VYKWSVITDKWWTENDRGKLKYRGQTYSSAILLTTNPNSKVLFAYLLHDWLNVFVGFLRYLFLFEYYWHHTARLKLSIQLQNSDIFTIYLADYEYFLLHSQRSSSND
jgi:hypothetical protein